jgi:hypothetical protein
MKKRTEQARKRQTNRPSAISTKVEQQRVREKPTSRSRQKEAIERSREDRGRNLDVRA